LYPFNNSEYFHRNCTPEEEMWTEPGNYSYVNEYGTPYNQTLLELCRCGDLPDLDQSNPTVEVYLLQWIHNVVVKYDFDGLRIDTVPYVSKKFWNSYFLAAQTIYSLAEIKSTNKTYVASYQYEVQLDPLNYPLYYGIYYTFGLNKTQRSSMQFLNTTIHENRRLFNDTLRLGNFIDNHDVPRFLHARPDLTAFKNAMAFILFAEGIPIIFYGSEQGFDGRVNYTDQYNDPDTGNPIVENCETSDGNDPCNRQSLWPSFNTQSPLYTFVAVAMKFRNYLAANMNDFFYLLQNQAVINDYFYSFSRAAVFVAVTSCGSDEPQIPDQYIPSDQHPFLPGQNLTDALGGGNVIVSSDGSFMLSMYNNLPRVLYVPMSVNEGGDEPVLLN